MNQGFLLRPVGQTGRCMFILAMTGVVSLWSLSLSAQDKAVSALGHIQPEHGVRRITVSSTPLASTSAVVTELFVEAGDDVKKGQLLAITDSAPVLEEAVALAQAQLQLTHRESESSRSAAEEACVRADVAESEAQRRASLLERGLAGAEEAESARGEAMARAASCRSAQTNAEAASARIKVAEAQIKKSRAELERAKIYAPMDGRVLGIIARTGEQIGLSGLLELGNVSRMFAVAEVYETEIRHVKVGQAATVSSPAFASDLTGRVHVIHQKVNKQGEISTDPAARKDDRIIEVEILLDDPEAAASLTHLQVNVVIGG
jgi:HlyD family secretion protein